MHTPIYKRCLVTVGITGLVLSLATSPALAQNPGRGTTKQELAQERVQEVKAKIASRAAELQLRRTEQREAAKERLAGVKLQTCEKRQEKIKQHSAKATERAEKLVSVFDAIADKADAFKTSKGIVVADYDNLLANVASQKAEAETKIKAAQDLAEAFSCTSDGPKAQLELFVAAMDELRSSLKEYKNDIRALVQAIRQANGQNRQATSSATPSAQEDE
jgi:chromosome segregation ATPase